MHNHNMDWLSKPISHSSVEERPVHSSISLKLDKNIAGSDKGLRHHKIVHINANITYIKSILAEHGCDLGRDCSMHVMHDTAHYQKEVDSIYFLLKFYTDKGVCEYFKLFWNEQ